MWKHWPAVAAGLSLILIACAVPPRVHSLPPGQRDNTPGYNGVTGSTDRSPIRSLDGNTTLPGVSIKFTTSQRKWSLAEVRAGLRIEYQVAIDHDVENVVPVAQDAGQCDEAHSSGLILFETLKGGGLRYGIYDQGLCFRPERYKKDPVTLRAGVYPGAFEWDGRSWDGPSDTFAQKGDYFPVGTYTLTVSAVGFQGPDDAVFRIVEEYELTLEE